MEIAKRGGGCFAVSEGLLEDLPETHEERARMLFSAGFMLGQREDLGELEQVFLISKGWMSVGDVGQPLEMRPRDDPKRKEVLFISNLVIRERKNRLALLAMVSDDGDKLIELREFERPRQEEEGNWDNPLLDAFAEGFR